MSGGFLAEFFTIAKKNCANYGAIGPYGKVDFCYPGPNTCVLKDDKFCPYFDRAVIGCKPFLEIGLQQKWQELWQGAPDKIINKICGICREEFRPISPRQKFCFKCKKLNQSEKARLRKRKQRDKNQKGSDVTLLAP